MDAKELSDRIGRTTVIIDALSNRIKNGADSVGLTIFFGQDKHTLPGEFNEVMMKAIHAVLMQFRALDAVLLAQAAGVPLAVEGADDVTIVVQAPRALPPKEDE